jgi:hypothetical protein
LETTWTLHSVITDARLKRSSTGHQVEDEHDDGKDQKDVNPSTQGVAADESYYPKDEKNNGDCPKHSFVLRSDTGLIARFAGDVCSAGPYLW